MTKPKQNNDARSYRRVRWGDEQLFSVGILPRLLDPARYNRYARVAMISKPEANATRLPDDGRRAATSATFLESVAGLQRLLGLRGQRGLRDIPEYRLQARQLIDEVSAQEQRREAGDDSKD